MSAATKRAWEAKHRGAGTPRAWDQRFRAAGGRLTSMRFTAAVRERLDTIAAANHCTRSDVVEALVLTCPDTIAHMTGAGLRLAAVMREHGMSADEARDFLRMEALA